MPHEITRSAGAIAFLAVVMLARPATSAAQTPVVTSAPPVVAAGPDYATDVLGNPWDFSDVLDVGPFPDELGGWTITHSLARTAGRAAFLRNGHFIGHTSGDGQSTVPLLFRGGVDIVNQENENVGVFDHKAIPTGRFGKLAVSMTVSAAAGGRLTATWFATPYGVSNPAGSGVAFRSPEAGTHIYMVDLETGVWTDARGNAVSGGVLPIGGLQPVSWRGTPLMRGLQVRPVTSAASVDVAVDWVRLTQRDGLPGAATIPIGFAGCAGSDYNVEVMAGSGTWDVIHAGRAAAGGVTTASVNHGVLPPGAWTFRVGCFPGSRAGGTPSYSAPFAVTISAPPVVTVHNPDNVGGADYATTVRGNAWDMNSLSDVAQLYGVLNPAVVFDGVSTTLQGTSPPGSGSAVVFVFGQTVDTSRFRHLTFALTLGAPFELGAPGGSVARIHFERAAGAGNAISTTQDILVWPGRNVYTFDLAALTVENGGLDPSCGCANLPWQASPIRYFRIDPHESARGVTFRLGPVLLTAHDEVAFGGSFPVQYSFADSDAAGSTYETRIYVDTDRDPGAKTLIDVVRAGVVPNTLLQYNLDPAGRGLSAGDYLIYVEVVESAGGATQTRGMYSSGPLRVGASAGPAAPGPPSLVAEQSAANPVTIAWAPGAGGAPTSYTVVAGTSPGTANLAVINVGMQTRVSGNVPPGLRIYVRVVASNAAGQAASNEISLVVGAGAGPPAQPRMAPPSVSGRTVALAWAPSPGPPPLGYVLVVRMPGNPTPIVTFPTTQTSIVVASAPPGTFVVSVVAVNAAGPSPESAPIVVAVP